MVAGRVGHVVERRRVSDRATLYEDRWWFNLGSNRYGGWVTGIGWTLVDNLMEVRLLEGVISLTSLPPNNYTMPGPRCLIVGAYVTTG